MTLRIKRLTTITILYWVLLLYIVAALVWWFISLQQQNNRMSGLLLNELKHDEAGYYQKVSHILEEKKRKTAQYIGEGATFLALILVGAWLVYRPIRRQLTLSMQQRNFMMAVTHELKTPIAVIHLNLETLKKRRLDEERQQKLIASTLDEVARLNSLCNNILLSAQLDAGEHKLSPNLVDLSSLANKVYNDFDKRSNEGRLIKKINEDLAIVGEEVLLELLMANLIENALKYSPKNTAVEVLLYADKNHIRFQVRDQGPGIADSEKTNIFDKFYRVGNEATRTAKGTGLGLYLCRQIAKDHNASIGVQDNNERGAVFTVTFKT